MESQKESLNSFLAMFPSWWNPSFATYTTFLQKPSSSTTRKQRYLQGSHAVKGQVTVENAWAGRERTGSLSGVGEGCPDFFLCFSLWIGNVGHWCFVCTLHRPHNESQMRQCMKKTTPVREYDYYGERIGRFFLPTDTYLDTYLFFFKAVLTHISVSHVCFTHSQILWTY